MKIQLNTDKNIKNTLKFESFVSEKLNGSFKRFANKITRIEVHITDQNADKKSTDDIQCRLEARLEGLKPIVVASKNSSKEKALNDAIKKLKATLDSVMGKLTDK